MSAVATASKIYDLFSVGDVPGIDALCSKNYKAYWNGDEGLEESTSFLEFAGKTFPKIGKFWPGFKLTPTKVVPSADGKAVAVFATASFRPGAPVPEAEYLHIWKVDDEGLVTEWWGFDDGYALNANKLPDGETFDGKKAAPVPADLASKVSALPAVDGLDGAAIADKVFETFTAGDIPGLSALNADGNYKGTWIGDKGAQTFETWEAVIGGVLARIPSTWPGFGVDPLFRIVSATGREVVQILKTKYREGAPVSSGYIGDYFQLDEAGKITEWTGFHDYHALKTNALVDKDTAIKELNAEAKTTSLKDYAATNLEYKDHPSFPNSRMVLLGPGKFLVEYAKGTTEPPHMHTSDLTWLLTKGTVRVSNPADPKSEKDITAPATWVVPGNTPHTVTALTEAQFIGELHGPVDMKPWSPEA